MVSIQPISSAAESALIYELEQISFLGTNPLTATTPDSSGSNTPSLRGKRLYNALRRLRERKFPAVLSSLSNTQIQVVHRTETNDPTKPLDISYLRESEYVYAAVLGPSAEALERGFVTKDDYEVIVAAQSLATELDSSDSIVIDGAEFDIIAIRGYPQHPDPVAYKFWIKRAS